MVYDGAPRTLEYVHTATNTYGNHLDMNENPVNERDFLNRILVLALNNNNNNNKLTMESNAETVAKNAALFAYQI